MTMAKQDGISQILGLKLDDMYNNGMNKTHSSQ
jgi:hypothetical protein